MDAVLRVIRPVLLLMLSMVLSGCLDESKTKVQIAAPLKTRNEALDDIESKLGCAGLKHELQSHIAEARKLKAALAAEENKPPPTIERMIKRSAGAEGHGTIAFDKLKKERERMVGINARLEKRGCGTVDIDRTLAE